MIDELRTDESAKTKIKQPLGDEIINALYKNDAEGSSRLLNQWLTYIPTAWTPP